MDKLRQVEMAIATAQAANFVMVQSQFLFGLAKTVLHRPTPKSDTQQPPQAHALLARHAVRYEVFYLLRDDVAGHDQAMPTARQTVVAPLAPEHRPFHFPDFRAAGRVLDAVTLPALPPERWRITQQVLHLARRPTSRQPRILILAAPTRRRPIAEHPRL